MDPSIMRLQGRKAAVTPLNGDLMKQNNRKRLIPANIAYKKEDLYDQNIELKHNINDYKDDNIRLRTRMQ